MLVSVLGATEADDVANLGAPAGERGGELVEGAEEDAALLERRIDAAEAPIDVESELARLTAPLVDPELRQEIRDLVIARNNRRVRAGKPPLDVDAEVDREVARLSEL